MTPIGQQNPPGRLKLLVFAKKICKIPIFDFAKKKKTDFLDAIFLYSCGGAWIGGAMRGCPRALIHIPWCRRHAVGRPRWL
jgi:hypothetical protein